MPTNGSEGLEFLQREVVLRADFDELDADRLLPVSMRFIMDGPRHPGVGEWVYLLDREGSGCLGLIEAIDGWIARVRPDWDSWTGGDRPAGAPPPVV